MTEGSIFGDLRRGGRIWAVASVRGDAARLNALHRVLIDRLETDDRLVYLGNLAGHSVTAKAAIDEALVFRRHLIGRRNGMAADVVFLRGAQEEMLQKLFELQFALGPADVLDWMLEQGLGGTIESYGGKPEEAAAAIRQSAVATTRWTSNFRSVFRNTGHQPWLSDLKHAAHDHTRTILFVSRGIDPAKPLDAQGDLFWWGGNGGFEDVRGPVAGFCRIIRGTDPAQRGLVEADHTISLDGGCGLGGRLIAACLNPDGSVNDVIEV